MNDYIMTTLITRTDRDVEVQLTLRADTHAIDLTGAWWRDTGEGQVAGSHSGGSGQKGRVEGQTRTARTRRRGSSWANRTLRRMAR